MHEPDKALKCFRRSLEKSTENPQAHFEMGKILYERNQLPLAKEARLSAVRDDANSPEYLARLSSVYLAMGDADAAIEYLRGVETTGLSVPTAYYTLARAYRNKGDAARSAAYMENFRRATSAERDREARKLEAERPIAQAQRELDRGNSQAARVLFEKALQVDPSQWESHAYIAEMDLPVTCRGPTRGPTLTCKSWSKLTPIYAEKVKLSWPGNSEVRALLGGIYVQLGEKYKARQEYEEAVRLAPERADLRQRLLRVGGKPQSQ